MGEKGVSFRRGFTIIELAISIIIVSTLIIAIFGGMQLKRTSETTQVILQLNRLIEAVNQFKAKYGAWPGDAIDATRQLGGTGIVNGDGDSLIDNGTAEVTQVILQLRAAGLLKQGNNNLFSSDNILTGPLAGSHFHFGSNADGNFVIFFSGYADLNSDNDVGDPGEQELGILTPNEMFMIDKQIDDGVPTTGNIRAIDNNGGANACFTGSSYNRTVTEKSCSFYYIVR